LEQTKPAHFIFVAQIVSMRFLSGNMNYSKTGTADGLCDSLSEFCCFFLEWMELTHSL